MAIRYASREEVDKGRKELVKITKRIGDLVTQQRELQTAISEYEKVCRHMWSKRKYEPNHDRFVRTCDLCGMIKYSKE